MELSVIVPVYNGAKTLEKTLSSLLSQHPLPFLWEVVAIDDGSTDKSLSLLTEFKARAEKLGISFQLHAYPNGGVGVCRNRGLSHAQGKSILYLDADDLLLPGALARSMQKKQETGAQILLFDSCYLYPDGKTEPFPMASHPGGFLTPEEYMCAQPCPWNKIIDRSLFLDSGLRFEEGILYEDLALIPALGSVATGKIYYEKKCLHFYYQSEESIMRSPWSEKRLDLMPALLALKRNTKGQERAVEYLFWQHLLRSFAWLCWKEGKLSALRKGSHLMKEHYPHWQKNPLIRKAPRKERFSAFLFYHNLFPLLTLWKGKKHASHQS